MKPPQPRETLIVRACMQWLGLRGVLCWRTNSGAMKATGRSGKERYIQFNSAPGMSDICGVLPGGRFLACEVKRPGKDATEEQAKFLEEVRFFGGLAIVVHSVEELAAAIERSMRRIA